MANIPTLRVRQSNDSIEDVHDAMHDVDLFYRRIVQYILNRIELVETESVLCYIIDDYNNKSTLILENVGDNWSKSLGKAMEYFEGLEEYETCDMIKQIKQNI